MYAYLNGKISFLSPTELYLDINGIGFAIQISLGTYSKLESKEAAKLFVYQHINVQDGRSTMYGFWDNDEKQIFIQLISVSGIGANTARIILSSMDVNQVKSAIVHEDVARFSAVKGIGPKTAKRLIIDLKDKVKLNSDVPYLSEGLTQSMSSLSIKNEAIFALEALGFLKNNAQKAVEKIWKEDLSLEDCIKDALNFMTK